MGIFLSTGNPNPFRMGPNIRETLPKGIVFKSILKHEGKDNLCFIGCVAIEVGSSGNTTIVGILVGS